MFIHTLKQCSFMNGTLTKNRVNRIIRMTSSRTTLIYVPQQYLSQMTKKLKCNKCRLTSATCDSCHQMKTDLHFLDPIQKEIFVFLTKAYFPQSLCKIVIAKYIRETTYRTSYHDTKTVQKEKFYHDSLRNRSHIQYPLSIGSALSNMPLISQDQ